MASPQEGGSLRRLWRWVVWFWWAKVRRQPDAVCRPDCPLCEVQARCEAHFESCATCQGDGFPCEAMKALQAEEDAATVKLFPDLADEVPRFGVATMTATNGTTSSIPVKVYPPWVWRSGER